MRKYSRGFERDYSFYLRNLNVFNFCGTLNPKHEAMFNARGKSAKEAFYFIQSQGKNYPCSEPDLLNNLLLAQAGINFQIKQWAEGRLEGTLPLHELSKKLAAKYYPQSDFTDCKILSWGNGKLVYYEDMQEEYNLPDWVIEAVQAQFYKGLHLKHNQIKKCQ